MDGKLRKKILEDMAVKFDKLGEEIAQAQNEKEENTQKKNSCQQEGDLRENAGYHAAIEAIQRLEVKIQKTSNKRDNWEKFKTIGEQPKGSQVVKIGSIVKVKTVESGLEGATFMLVPAKLGQADIGSVSIESGVGKGVLGKKVGDRVTIRTAGYGVIVYEVVTIN